MKKSILYLLAVLLISLLASCHKEPEKTIVFGNSKGMTVTSYEGIPLVNQYGHNSWGYFVDLNNDGQNDVQFHSTSEILGGGILTELYCQENAALLGTLDNQEFSLLANNANDSFGNDDTFMCTDVKLRDGDKYNFPKDETKYIGFKITGNNRSRLSWMKVILHEDEVELLETAIQK